MSANPTDVEVDEALARLAPGVHRWTEEERARMRAVLAAPSDEDALQAWSWPPSAGLAVGPLRNVQAAAIHAVREAHAWGREHCGGRT